MLLMNLSSKHFLSCNTLQKSFVCYPKEIVKASSTAYEVQGMYGLLGCQTTTQEGNNGTTVLNNNNVTYILLINNLH